MYEIPDNSDQPSQSHGLSAGGSEIRYSTEDIPGLDQVPSDMTAPEVPASRSEQSLAQKEQSRIEQIIEKLPDLSEKPDINSPEEIARRQVEKLGAAAVRVEDFRVDAEFDADAIRTYSDTLEQALGLPLQDQVAVYGAVERKFGVEFDPHSVDQEQMNMLLAFEAENIRMVGNEIARPDEDHQDEGIEEGTTRAEEYAQYRAEVLDKYRRTFGILRDDDTEWGSDVREKVEAYLNDGETGVPPIFADWKNGSFSDQPQPERTWADWLADPNTSDDQLVNFYQWHGHAVDALNNDPAIQSAIEARRGNFTDSTRQLYESGALHGDGDEALAIVEDTSIFVGDPILMDLENKQGSHFETEDGRHIITLHPRNIGDPHSMAAEHELAHIIIDDDSPQLIEGVVDILAAAAHTNSLDPKEIYRAIRKDNELVPGYAGINRLVHANMFYDGPPGNLPPIDVKKLLRYGSAQNPEQKLAARQELEVALRARWNIPGSYSGPELLDTYTQILAQIAPAIQAETTATAHLYEPPAE